MPFLIPLKILLYFVQFLSGKMIYCAITTSCNLNFIFLADFKRWAIPPRTKVGPEHEYKKPEVKMESTSTFQKVS